MQSGQQFLLIEKEILQEKQKKNNCHNENGTCYSLMQLVWFYEFRCKRTFSSTKIIIYDMCERQTFLP